MFHIHKLAAASAICLSLAAPAAAITETERQQEISQAVKQDQENPPKEPVQDCTDDLATDRGQADRNTCSEEPFDQARAKVNAQRILDAITAPIVLVNVKAVNAADKKQR